MKQRVSDERIQELLKVNDYAAIQSHASPVLHDLFDARAEIERLERELAEANAKLAEIAVRSGGLPDYVVDGELVNLPEVEEG